MIKEVFVEFDAPKEGTVFSDPTTNSLFELFQEDKAICFVVEENGVVQGCCGIFPTKGLPKRCTELVKFYLPNAARGKGYGKILMQKCEESAIEMGYTQIYIESLPHFDKAVSIYKKNGYSQLDKPLGDSGHFGCNIWMVKNIKNNTFKIS
jgi:putative acetyltransferase